MAYTLVDRNGHQHAYTRDELLDVVHVMADEGGSFVHALANLWFVSDSGNKAKLLAAFNDVFMQYVDLHEFRAR